MLNRHVTASGRSILRMVVALALVGVGAAWLLSRARPARMPPLREQARAPHPVSPEVPNQAEPLWASVAGEEDPGAAVEPPPAATVQRPS